MSDFDLNGLEDFHNHIIKTTIQNKVLRNGTIDYGMMNGEKVLDFALKLIEDKK